MKENIFVYIDGILYRDRPIKGMGDSYDEFIGHEETVASALYILIKDGCSNGGLIPLTYSEQSKLSDILDSVRNRLAGMYKDERETVK